MPEIKTDTAQYSCKLAGEVFQVLDFSSREDMSELFRFSLNLWSDNPEVDIKGKLRQPAEIKIKWGDKEKKYFGIVANMSQTEAGRVGETDKEYGHYAVEIVPTLWLLGQKANCRIFQEKTTDAIIKAVLDERGMSGKYTPKLNKTYPNRTYCVQYRETDLDFISRLMEEEGIFYFFTHDGEEKMILGDATSAYATCSPEKKVQYKKGTGGLATDKEYFDSLVYEESAYTGKVKFKDFDYDKPKNPLKVEDTAEKNTDLEIYDYHPERYDNDGRGRALAKVAVEAESAMRKTLEASGDWRSVTAGHKFTLEKAYRSDLDIEWVIISATHRASQEGDGLDYDVSVVAIPASVVFRPMPHTPQPALNPQTATVVGPKGEEIYMDDLGRAKVQFHWDLEGKKDEKSSCWIRVAQHYAGINEDDQKKHGFHWHPLIGDEVIVDFLEGDPDTPLIVGSVYNGVNTPPIKPDQLIRNMMLTRYQHCLLFDDKNSCITMATGGSEVLHMNDKKKEQGSISLTTAGKEVLHMEDVSDDFGNTIGLETKDKHGMLMAEKGEKRGIQMRTKDKHAITMSDHEKAVVLQTTKEHIFRIDDKEKYCALSTTDGHLFRLDDKDNYIVLQSRDGHSITVDDKKQYIQVVDANGMHSIKIDIGGSAIQITTQGDISMSAGGGCSISAGGSITMSAGQDIKATAGSKIKNTAGAQFEVTSPKIAATAAGKISVESGGTIDAKAGASVDVKAGGTAKVTAGGSLDLKAGGKASLQAGGITIIRGALVKIN